MFILTANKINKYLILLITCIYDRQISIKITEYMGQYCEHFVNVFIQLYTFLFCHVYPTFYF